jgi:hypothetical protein
MLEPLGFFFKFFSRLLQFCPVINQFHRDLCESKQIDSVSPRIFVNHTFLLVEHNFLMTKNIRTPCDTGIGFNDWKILMLYWHKFDIYDSTKYWLEKRKYRAYVVSKLLP